MTVLVQQVFAGRNNSFGLAFREQNLLTGVTTPVSFAAVTRMVLTLLDASPAFTVDQADLTGDRIDWSDAGAVGLVNFKLGAIVGLPAAGRYNMRLTAYTGASPIELVHDRMDDEIQVDIFAT